MKDDSSNVLILDYSGNLFIGHFKSMTGCEVELTKAHRIHSMPGATSIPEFLKIQADEYKSSPEIDMIRILNVMEIKRLSEDRIRS